jgi:hypothetical protein
VLIISVGPSPCTPLRVTRFNNTPTRTTPRAHSLHNTEKYKHTQKEREEKKSLRGMFFDPHHPWNRENEDKNIGFVEYLMKHLSRMSFFSPPRGQLKKKRLHLKNGGRPPQRGFPSLGSGSAVAFHTSLHHGRPFAGCPAPPRPPNLVFILRHHQHAAAERRPAYRRRRSSQVKSSSPGEHEGSAHCKPQGPAQWGRVVGVHAAAPAALWAAWDECTCAGAALLATFSL